MPQPNRKVLRNAQKRETVNFMVFRRVKLPRVFYEFLYANILSNIASKVNKKQPGTMARLYGVD